MNRPWMPLYIADYLADTPHLTTAEHGAYLLLIMAYWTRGHLPADEEGIRRITRMSPRQWAQSRNVLRALFGNEWRHKRCDAELAKAIEKSSVASANAKRRLSGRIAGAERAQTQPQSLLPLEEKKDTGANAPAAPDFRTELFRRGVDQLVAMTGKSKDAARAFIGKQLKIAEDDAVVVLEAIDRAVDARPADPGAYIAGCIRSRPPPGGKPSLMDIAMGRG